MKSVAGCATPSDSAWDAPARDEDRIPGLGNAHRVGPRVAPAAPGRVAEQAAASARPGDPSRVDVDVMGVVGGSVVPPQVDRLGEHTGIGGIGEIRDPDRAPVAAASRDESAEIGLVVPARGPARPHVMAVLDAARRVPCGQLDEVSDLFQVRRVFVRDDVEARAASRVSSGARAGAIRLVDVVVARVECTDDQVPAHVEIHVLVLPVAVGAEDVGRLERVQQLWRLRIADVVGLEAEPPGHDEDLAFSDRVELAFHDARRSRDARDVLERVRDHGARWRLDDLRGRSGVEHNHQSRGYQQTKLERHRGLPSVDGAECDASRRIPRQSGGQRVPAEELDRRRRSPR